MRGSIPYYGASGIVDYVSDYIFDEELVLLGEDGENIISRNLPLAFRIEGKSWVNNHAHVMRMKDGLDATFLANLLESKNFEKYNSGTAQPKLNKQACLAIPVAVPPIQEQKAIAQALRDIDDLIASLDALIAKKREIKQAAMQQLLTGKTRLKGFDGPWVSQRLGELSKIKTGSRNNQDKSDGGDYPFFVRSATVERISTFSYDCEAILVPGEGGIGSIFHYVLGKFDAHQRVYVINDFRGIAGRFLYHQMVMSFGPYAMQNSVKATVDSLRLPTFQTFEVHMPSSMEEQNAIAEAIDAFVNEITILEARMEKVTALKEGMMQQLLTGQVRLV